jgi:hypothetical protein
MGKIQVCICGKVCTSKAGLILHHRNCEEAQKALKEGGSAVQESDVQEPEIQYVPEVQEIVSLVKEMAFDAHRAIQEGNKSAGRRARNSLNELKHKITPLRKLILSKMQGKTDVEE